MATKTAAQMLTALAGLLVPVSLRAWLRDLIVVLTPAYAGMERSAQFTVTAVGQTPLVISFAGGNSVARGDQFIASLPAGKITRTTAGTIQFGVQVTVELPTGVDVVVQLFKGGVATVYRTQLGTDNKAYTSTFVMNGITVSEAGTDYDLRIYRLVGTSDLVVAYTTFYMTTL
jgi:hypothetical protein